MRDHDHAAQIAAYGRCIACTAGTTGTEARPPIVRRTDLQLARDAAERIEPTRGTRKSAVLDLLRSTDTWVDGSEIASPAVGGSEGLRRLRELREADGWPIEHRAHPDSATAWQYRLAPAVDDPVQTVEEPSLWDA